MKEVRSSIDITAPASQVWDVLLDLERYDEWNPSLPAIRGESQRDAEIKVAGEDPDREVRAKITELNRNRMFSWQLRPSLPALFEKEHIFEITPAGPGRTRLANRVQFRGLIARLIRPDKGQELTRRLAAMNRALRHRVEHRSVFT